MSSDPTDQPDHAKRDVTPDSPGPSTVRDGGATAAPADGSAAPVLSGEPAAATGEVRLTGDDTGPVPDRSPDPGVVEARGPDRVAIAMMVGVVVLLLICVAFALAAR